eukprot:TRINITY_DN1023_c0_g1_i1.p1 TRINITY_DN1023_c0_g1~~TRINITY_DN1023_c0_g1_i1.p1  ORF type:complete len:234 (-),score=46.29 TRINITY_DN1023_c0_g1_i1:56-757(-)
MPVSFNSRRNVLLVFTNHEELGVTRKQTGYYLPEAAHPYHVFTENGFRVDFVSPKGGKVPLDKGSWFDFKDDPVCKSFLNSASVLAKLNNTLPISAVNPDNYSTIFFVGGHGPMWDIAQDSDVARVAARIYENGGVVSAVCHGPAGLVPIRINGEPLVKGKKVACFSNSEEEIVHACEIVPFLLESKLREQGAIYSKAAPWNPHVVGDQRVFTGQNPASGAPLAEAIVKFWSF